MMKCNECDSVAYRRNHKVTVTGGSATVESECGKCGRGWSRRVTLYEATQVIRTMQGYTLPYIDLHSSD